jgi:hypothetical protein
MKFPPLSLAHAPATPTCETSRRDVAIVKVGLGRIGFEILEMTFAIAATDERRSAIINLPRDHSRYRADFALIFAPYSIHATALR